jgi:hypothetical protein
MFNHSHGRLRRQIDSFRQQFVQHGSFRFTEVLSDVELSERAAVPTRGGQARAALNQNRSPGFVPGDGEENRRTIRREAVAACSHPRDLEELVSNLVLSWRN